jgi:hypothetical protein
VAEDVISGIDLNATTVAKRTHTMIKADAKTTTIGIVSPSFLSAKTPHTSGCCVAGSGVEGGRAVSESDAQQHRRGRKVSCGQAHPNRRRR